MAMKKAPLKANLHNAAKAISNADMSNLTKVKNTVKERVQKRQEEIDNYNFEEVFKAPEEMKHIQL
jgi:gas vesicle protein